MVKCKVASDQTFDCGKDICCHYCDEEGVCSFRCEEPNNCVEQLFEETELQVMQSAVPEAIKIITDINIQKKKLDEQEKLMRQKRLEARECSGIKKYENERNCITNAAPYSKTTIDSPKLKKKYPDIAEECSKVSNVSASVRISVK